MTAPIIDMMKWIRGEKQKYEEMAKKAFWAEDRTFAEGYVQALNDVAAEIRAKYYDAMINYK